MKPFFKSKHVLNFYLFLVCLFYISCTSKNSNSTLTTSGEDSIGSVIFSSNAENNIEIKDAQMRMFAEEFILTKEFPINLERKSYDTTHTIPDNFVKKYIKGNAIKYYYGISFLARDSIYGLIYHYIYKKEPQQVWDLGTTRVGSNIIYINKKGKKIDKINDVYFDSKEENEIGEVEQRNHTIFSEDGGFVLYKYIKILRPKKMEEFDFEEIEYSTNYYINNKNEINKGETKIYTHKTNEINSVARMSVLNTISEILDIKFIGVVRQNEAYFQLNKSCVVSEWQVINTPEELKKSNSSFIHERYLPIWVDKNNDYSTELIIDPTYNELTGELSFTAKSFEVMKDNFPVINLDQQGYKVQIFRSENGYWMRKPDSLSNRSFMEDELALTLPVSDISCDQ